MQSALDVNGLTSSPPMEAVEKDSVLLSSSRLSPCIWPGLLSLLLPVHLAQVIIGFRFKHACPIDAGLPRFLLFGGLAGLMALGLKVMMACAWGCSNKGVNYDVRQHPGISMVRTVRYMFILFLVIWNCNETFHFFAFRPDLENDASEDYCHPTVYYVCLISICVFNFLVMLFVFIWLSAIILGICNKEILLSSGYFVSSEAEFATMSKMNGHKSDVVDGGQTLRRVLAKKHKLDEITEDKECTKLTSLSSDADNSSSSSDSEDNRNSLSIVRFAREVNSRRISNDYRRESDRWDITHFPLGPPASGEANVDVEAGKKPT